MTTFKLTIESDDPDMIAHIAMLAQVILREGELEPNLDRLIIALDWLFVQISDLSCLAWEENRQELENLIIYHQTFGKHLHEALGEAVP